MSNPGDEPLDELAGAGAKLQKTVRAVKDESLTRLRNAHDLLKLQRLRTEFVTLKGDIETAEKIRIAGGEEPH